eukprot:749668-Hanusia_phi.AAC.2
MKQKKALWYQRLTESLLFGSPVQPQSISLLWSAQHLVELENAAKERLKVHAESKLSSKASSASTEAARKVKPAPAAKSSNKKKAIQEMNEQKAREMAIEKVKSTLENLRNDYKIKANLKQWSLDVERYVEKLRSLIVKEGGDRGPDSLAKRLAWRFEILEIFLRCENESEEMRKETFLLVQEILRHHHDVLSEMQLELLLKAAAKTQLPDLVDVLRSLLPSGSKAVSRLKVKASYSPMTAVEYQLAVAPEHLERARGTEFDLRVGFAPDEWQKKLLDVVDSQSSALVVAPTASGKTFISYYVMERCLRSSDEGVVVFVAPTKALVNQVRAEVEARFSKTFNRPGTSLCGVFTRDFRENEMTCQILVTVPQCFGILLMSGENVSWASRVQTVILDEVHSIGEKNGEIWEQIILLIPCPFIALSATLGNDDYFASWLGEVEQTRGRRLHLVRHNQRFNDLR